MLVRTIVMSVTGSLGAQVLPQLEPSFLRAVFAVCLSLPLPFHIISIGMVLQRRWFSSRWGRIAWIAILVSGLWLGASLVLKMIIHQ